MVGLLVLVIVAIPFVLVYRANQRARTLGSVLLPVVPPTGPGPLLPPDRPALPTPQKGAGSETLVGLVVDGAGMPAGNVAVTAIVESALAPAGAPATAVVGITGLDGHFELEGVVPGRHRVTLEGEGIFTAEVRFVPVPADVMRFVIARRVAIAGAVTDGGAPLPGATVALDSDALLGARTATADAQGRFAFDELPEGSYRLWAWQGERAARAVRVPRLGAGPFADVTLEVEPAAVVTGRVIDRQTGAGVAAAVTLTAQSADEAPRHARTDGAGSFRIEGVPHGRWAAEAWAPGWLAASSVDFTAGRGSVIIELVPGGVAEGVVVDATGAPVAGATVAAIEDGAGGREVSAAAEDDRLRRALGLSLRAPAASAMPVGGDAGFVPRGELGVMLGPIPFAPPPGASRTTAATIVDDPDRAPIGDAPAAAPIAVDPAYVPTWVTGADGKFRLTGMPAGNFILVAEAPGHVAARSKRTTFALGQVVGGLELVLRRGVYVAGRVTDQRGTPVTGAIVGFTPDGAPGGRGAIEVITDPDGRYRAGPLAGSVAIHARAWGHGDHRAQLALVESPDDRAYDITLVVADAAIEGVVEDPAGLPVVGARVVVDGGPADGRATVAGPGGRFRIAMLPEGALGVRVEHPDYPPQRFTETTGDAARLRLAFGGGLELVVFDHHTGENLPGLPVLATGPAGARRETVTDPSGRVRLVPLAPGPWRLLVKTPGYLERRLEVAVAAGDRPAQITAPDLRLELERGATLAGIVRDLPGNRVAGATVSVRRGDDVATTTTDADGEFRLRDVPTGDVELTAQKGALRATVPLELRAGDERLTLEVGMQ